MRRKGSTFRARISVAMIVAAVVMVPAGPANAAVQVTYKQGVLTVEGGNADDTIVIACTGGLIKVNGMDPASGPKPCANVERIVVRSGAGNDQIDADGLLLGFFPSLERISAFGEAGNDWYHGGQTFPDTFVGGSGNNSIQYLGGTPGTFTLTNTKLSAFGDVDTIADVGYVYFTLPNGTNTLNASAFGGHILALGGTGNDSLTGTAMGDDLRGGAGINTLNAGKGDDLLYDGGGTDAYNAGPGDDAIIVLDIAANVSVTNTLFTNVVTDTHGGVERFLVTQTGAMGRTVNFGAFSGSLTWTGESGGDTVTAPEGGSSLTPEGGNDIVNAGAGDDRVVLTGVSFAASSDTTATSSDGTDTLNGSLDAMVVQGTSGMDTLNMSSASRPNALYGYDGADTLIGGAGPDYFFGLTGGDSVTGGAGGDSVFIFPTGSITVTDSTISGNVAAALSSIEGIIGTFGNNAATLDASAFTGNVAFGGEAGRQRMTGGSGDDQFSAGAGKDVLRGGSGKDLLEGEGGNDRLNGGPNTDTCHGGPGANRLQSCEKT